MCKYWYFQITFQIQLLIIDHLISINIKFNKQNVQMYLDLYLVDRLANHRGRQLEHNNNRTLCTSSFICLHYFEFAIRTDTVNSRNRLFRTNPTPEFRVVRHAS